MDVENPEPHEAPNDDEPRCWLRLADGVRRSGTSIITGLHKAGVQYNQQRHGIGTGSGLCFGDSGSPQLDHGTLLVLSVTSGGNGQCNAKRGMEHRFSLRY